jgi:hypothetical protein
MKSSTIIFDSRILLMFAVIGMLCISASPASANLIVAPARLGILRLQLYPFSPAVAVRTFTVGNTDNTSMQIALSPGGNMTGYIDIQEANFTLMPGENKTIQYTVNIDKPGYYDGSILVKAAISGKGAVGYNAEIAVFVNEANLMPYIAIGAGTIIVAAALAYAFVIRKPKTRSKIHIVF